MRSSKNSGSTGSFPGRRNNSPTTANDTDKPRNNPGLSDQVTGQVRHSARKRSYHPAQPSQDAANRIQGIGPGHLVREKGSEYLPRYLILGPWSCRHAAKA